MSAPNSVGGQAVIEGVMMRAASGLAVAVRRQGGEIVIKDRRFRSICDRFPLFKLPGLRGIVVLLETLAGGFEALNFSADQAAIPAGDEEQKKPPTDKGPSKVGNALTMVLAVGFAIALFVALPHGLTYGVGRLFGELSLESVVFHLVTGLFKLTIFVAYLALLSLIPDIRRVFMYHGAEHKVIATHEAKEPLDVEHARRHTTFHTRCGTSFLLVVVVAAIFLYAMVIPWLPGLDDRLGSHLVALLVKIPLLFPIGALAYEFNRWAANHLDHALVRLLVSPGFLMQRLTTREPTDDMLEVAIASLRAALERHAGDDPQDSVVVYRDFAEICNRLV
jgi:uncharacterized protein YqhQ